jgi:hypothetical protein
MKTATQLKFIGLEKAASHHAVDLARAKAIAQVIGMMGRPITADDVREAFETHEGRKLDIGNAMGSLFDKKHWEFAGFLRSKRPNSHARTIRTWMLKTSYPKQQETVRELVENHNVRIPVGTDNGERFCLKCSEPIDKCSCPNESLGHA